MIAFQSHNAFVLKLLVFIILMLGAVAAIGIWSVATGAALSTVLIRIVITVVALQLAYFAVLMVVGFLPPRKPEVEDDSTTDAPQSPAAKAIAENND